PAERLRLPDAQHAEGAPVVRRALPGDALHPREPRHLPARRRPHHPAARAADPHALRRRPHGPGTPLAGGAVVKRALSNVLAVAYRESVVLRHDKGFLTTVMAQPVILLLLYSYGISFTPANVQWAVLDRSATVASRRLVADIFTSGYFERPVAVASYAEGRALLRRGSALAFLVVPRDFSRDLSRGHPQVQLLVDGTDPVSAARVLAYVSQVASRFDAGRALPDRAPAPARPPTRPTAVPHPSS